LVVRVADDPGPDKLSARVELDDEYVVAARAGDIPRAEVDAPAEGPGQGDAAAASVDGQAIAPAVARGARELPAPEESAARVELDDQNIVAPGGGGREIDAGEAHRAREVRRDDDVACGVDLEIDRVDRPFDVDGADGDHACAAGGRRAGGLAAVI